MTKKKEIPTNKRGIAYIYCVICRRNPVPNEGNYGRYGNAQMVCKYCKKRTKTGIEKGWKMKQILTHVYQGCPGYAPHHPQDCIHGYPLCYLDKEGILSFCTASWCRDYVQKKKKKKKGKKTLLDHLN